MTARRWMVVMALALAAAGAAGCKSEPNQGKLMPKLAPPPGVDVPADLKIVVDIDGTEAPVIDAARLGAVKPDFADDERRAWRLETLIGPKLGQDGTTVYASGAHDLSVELRPHTPDGLIAVIMVSRRGDVIATMVEEKQPFPQFHGQGGRLGRPGDPLPRVPKVQKLHVVTTAAPSAPAGADAATP